MKHPDETKAALFVKCAQCNGDGWYVQPDHNGDAEQVQCADCLAVGYVPFATPQAVTGQGEKAFEIRPTGEIMVSLSPPKTPDALKILEKYRDEWSQDHGHTECDTGAWILNEGDQTYLDAMDDCIKKLKTALLQQQPDVKGLHSKIDMDIEDEIGRELSLEESRIVGLAIRKALNHE